jgi:hypothetical protein
MKMIVACTLCTAVALVSLSLMAADTPPPQSRAASAPAVQPRATSAPAARAPAASAPASRPEEEDESSADAVIKALLESRGGETVILPKSVSSQPTSEPGAASRPAAPPPPMPPGAMIYQRVGRLVKDGNGEWWSFHFESEKSGLVEPPMRVLPNRLLEAMETNLERSAGSSVRFIISGEVTEYKGQQYLLIRKQVVKRDMGTL